MTLSVTQPPSRRRSVARARVRAASGRESWRFALVFGGTWATLLVLVVALVLLADPLGVFRTGLLPPIASTDRDHKALLLARRRPAPEILVLGSSRVKMLRPATIARRTGRTAFNLGLNAGGIEDDLAALRYARSLPGARPRLVLLGLDPEALLDDAGARRPLAESRALARFAPGATGTAPRLGWDDLFGAQVVGAAGRALARRWLPSPGLPQEELEADGFQYRPRADAMLAAGAYDQPGRVRESAVAIRTRYGARTRLAPGRLATLATLLREARAAGVAVVAFLPPVHPELARQTATTPLPALTAAVADTLRAAAARGELRYVETRRLEDFGGRADDFYDAIHMTPANGDRLLARILGGS